MSREPMRRRYARFFRPDPRRDVDEEIAFHFEMRVAEFVRAGMTAEQAREVATRRFGNVARVREECEELSQRRQTRRQRAFQLDALRQDVRYAFRTLAANRSFSIVVALTMALGIGATIAVFSVAYGVLLRPLPYRDADALVRLWSTNKARNLAMFSVSPADYMEWRAQNHAFSAMGAFERQRDAIVLRPPATAPLSIEAAGVTPDVFPMLGTRAWMGRPLMASDAQGGAPPVAVISHELWTTQFGSDSAMIGRDLSIDGRARTVVGVMPPRFSIPGSPSHIWTPLAFTPEALADHGNRFLRVLGRLAPGVTRSRMSEEMDLIAARLAAAYPGSNALWSVTSVPVPEWVIGTKFRRAILALLGVVGFVLLIACSNAANLQLARAAARRREVAVRAALGASRGRIMRQLLTETVVLAGVAGIAGLGLAYSGIALLRVVGESTVPRLPDIRIDGPVLAFTVVVALGSGVLFGLLPALGASRPGLTDALKGGGRGEGSATVGQGIRSALVVVEVALSLMLLVGAGLLTRSFMRLESIDLGFDAKNVSVVPFSLPTDSYKEPQRVAAFYAAVQARVNQLPGVTASAVSTSPPFAGVNTGFALFPDDRPVPPTEQPPDADARIVTPGYFGALGIRLVRGRDFSTLDRPDAPATMLVSETMARLYWPNQDPIGHTARIGHATQGSLATIVGVVADVRYFELEAAEVRPMMYFSALRAPRNAMVLSVRGADAGALAGALRSIVASIDATIPAPTVRSLSALVGTATASRRFALVLFAIFAGVALVLAAVGIYGVMSYLVRLRTHELGVRIALGAPARALIGAVVVGTVRLVSIGVAIGIGGAWLLTRFLSELLYGVTATDGPTFGAVALLLIVVAVAASVAPARRATRADPLRALRGDC